MNKDASSGTGTDKTHQCDMAKECSKKGEGSSDNMQNCCGKK
jgi:hypothetical protein